jgi:hypothetical protein
MDARGPRKSPRPYDRHGGSVQAGKVPHPQRKGTIPSTAPAGCCSVQVRIGTARHSFDFSGQAAFRSAR